jgi:hypothetical protein
MLGSGIPQQQGGSHLDRAMQPRQAGSRRSIPHVDGRALSDTVVSSRRCVLARILDLDAARWYRLAHAYGQNLWPALRKHAPCAAPRTRAGESVRPSP